MTGNTEHGARNTEHNGPAPLLRSATPGPRSATGWVELPPENAERSAEHGTPERSTAPRSTEHPTEHGTHSAGRTPFRPWRHRNARTAEHGAPERSSTVQPAEHGTRTADRSPFRAWRERSARTAEQRSEAARTARLQRNTERLAAEQREADRRTAATRSALRARTTNRTTSGSGAREEIAPIPRRMVWVGIWLARTFGALPLVAPLIVSGWFTMNVFRADPIFAPDPIALLITLALEGGVFKLVKVYGDTLLEGDSTIGLRLGIGVYLAVISGLIYWHAWHLAGLAAEQHGLPAAAGHLGWGWLPAAGTALFSALGVFICGKDARFQHRVALRAADRVDRQAPKFSAWSWVLCPWETPWAFRHAVKFRLERPSAAVDDYRLWKEAGKPTIWPELDEADLGPIEVAEHPDGTELVHGTLLRDQVALEAAPNGTVERSAGDPFRRTVPFNGTWNGTDNGAPRNGAVHGTGNGTRPIAVRIAEHHGTVHGTPGPVNGTPIPGGGAPRSAPSTNGAESGDSEGADLKYPQHILDITAAYPNWPQRLPSFRNAIAAIDAASRARGGTGFSSMSTTKEVLDLMRRLGDDPTFVAAIEELRQRTTH